MGECKEEIGKKMNDIIFESKLRGLLKEFQTKITLNKLEDITYKVIGEVVSDDIRDCTAKY